MNDFYVYQYLRCVATNNGPVGSPYYVGKGKGKRAWVIGGHSVTVPSDPACIVMVSTGLSEIDAFTLERELIAQYGRINNGTGILRNLTDGGYGPVGFKHSDESKKKMSRSQTGRKLTLEARAKVSAAMSRKRGPMPPERRAKMSLIMKGRPSVRKGSRHTEQSIQKMRESHLRVNQEIREKEIANKLDSFYARINSMKMRAQSGFTSPASNQPTHGGTSS